MTPTITVVRADLVVAKIGRLVPGLMRQAAIGLQRFGIHLQGYIRAVKLTGGNPLNRRTGQLSDNVNVAPVEEKEGGLWSAVGTNLPYGRVHELGGTFQIPAHQRTISQIFGHPITPRVVMVSAHTATYPERSFLRAGLAEDKQVLVDEMEAARDRAVKE